MEARSRLHAFMRDEDKKLSYKANELIMKHSAAAYGPAGAVTCPDPGPAKPHEGNAEIHARLSRVLDEARTEIDRKRAKAGQPPVTNADFMGEWQKELDSRPPRREPIKVYFDEEGNAIDPPGEGTTAVDAKFDSHNVLIPPEAPKPAEPVEGPARQAGPTGNRDLVWGVLLCVSMLSGRGPADADRSDKLPACRATSWQLVATEPTELRASRHEPHDDDSIVRLTPRRSPVPREDTRFASRATSWQLVATEASERRGVSPACLARYDGHVGLTPRRSPIPHESGTPTMAAPVPPRPVSNELQHVPVVDRHVRVPVRVVEDKVAGIGVASQRVGLVIVGPAAEPVVAGPALVRVVGRHRAQHVGLVAAVENVVAQSASEGAVAVDAVEAVVPIGDKWAGENGSGPRGPPSR